MQICLKDLKSTLMSSDRKKETILFNSYAQFICHAVARAEEYAGQINPLD